MRNLMVFTVVLVIAIGMAGVARAAEWTTSGTDIYNANTGNVFIGTTDPILNSKLNVEGDINLGNPESRAIRMGWQGRYGVGFNAGAGKLNLFVASGAIGMGFGRDGGTYGTGWAEWMTIDGTYGNVGIGTTSPGSKLQVEGDINLGSPESRAIKMGYQGRYGVGFNSGPGKLNLFVAAGAEGIGFGRDGGTYGTGWAEWMTIDGTYGDVGIGITDPQAKLDVDGDILATDDADTDTILDDSVVSVVNLSRRIVVLEATPPEAQLLARLEALEAIVLDLPPGLLNQKDRNIDNE